MDLKILESLAHRKMEEHNLNGWKFKITRSVRRFGHCNWSRKIIGISKHLAELNTEESCLNTLLHEFAHALVGPGEGHGRIWKRKALEIGCDGERCYSKNKTICVVPKYEAYCVECGKSVGQYFRRNKLVHRICKTPLKYIKIINSLQEVK